MGNQMGIFSDVGNAKVNKTGSYFLARKDRGPARYIVEIVACKTQKSSRDNRLYCVIEGRVKASSIPEVQVGDERAQLIDMTSKMGPINVRKFVAAVLGIDPFGSHDDVTLAIEREAGEMLGRACSVEAACEWIFGDSNPLGEAAAEVGLVCTLTQTKGTKRDFTVHEWHPIATFEI